MMRQSQWSTNKRFRHAAQLHSQYNANVIIIILICQHIDLSFGLLHQQLFATLMEHKLSSNVLCDQWQYQYKVEIISSSSSSNSIDVLHAARGDFAPTSEVTTFFRLVESERKFNFQMQTIFSFVILLFYRVVLWDDVEGASSSSRSSKAINIDDRWRIHEEDEEFFFVMIIVKFSSRVPQLFSFVLAFRDSLHFNLDSRLFWLIAV